MFDTNTTSTTLISKLLADDPESQERRQAAIDYLGIVQPQTSAHRDLSAFIARLMKRPQRSDDPGESRDLASKLATLIESSGVENELDDIVVNGAEPDPFAGEETVDVPVFFSEGRKRMTAAQAEATYAARNPGRVRELKKRVAASSVVKPVAFSEAPAPTSKADRLFAQLHPQRFRQLSRQAARARGSKPSVAFGESRDSAYCVCRSSGDVTNCNCNVASVARKLTAAEARALERQLGEPVGSFS